ncbi:MAG: hypothetical protein AAF282_12490, partial [Cyanobacteria bacterium P01_A01_bin.15]
MATIKKPDLSDPQLREKLKQGMGHNYYGEPAWPNDLLYIFPVVILGSCTCESLWDDDYSCSNQHGFDCKNPAAPCFGEESTIHY